MRTFFLTLSLVLSFCINLNAQNSQEITEKARAWQQKMGQTRGLRPDISNNKSFDTDVNTKDNGPKFNRFDRFSNQNRLPYYHNRWSNPPMPMPPVGYFPIIQWYPQGAFMHVGPMMVSPDRRYVRFGINAGFYRINGFETYQMR